MGGMTWTPDACRPGRVWAFRVLDLPHTRRDKCLPKKLETSAPGKAGRTEIALRGYQKIQRANFKAALKKCLDDLAKQAAMMSIDW